MMKDGYKFNLGEKVVYLKYPDQPFEVVSRREIGDSIYSYLIISPDNANQKYWCIELELMTWTKKPKPKRFKKGDIVLVAGYLLTDYWKVKGYVEDGTFGGMHEVINIKTGYEMLACTEDMALVNKEEAEKIMNQHINKEKQILKKLAENKKKIEKLKTWNDMYFELFLMTKNKKYLRRIEKINQLISKIPTRAYEIE